MQNYPFNHILTFTSQTKRYTSNEDVAEPPQWNQSWPSKTQQSHHSGVDSSHRNHCRVCTTAVELTLATEPSSSSLTG
ncbi:hypothetical protein RIF29_37942 [Crotalaria pallida]|uniref:Uncharacterized protein n=1 Tax=Crotalaria pallida TaxID=3830 RepID=A0AAN9DY76_CROPI